MYVVDDTAEAKSLAPDLFSCFKWIWWLLDWCLPILKNIVPWTEISELFVTALAEIKKDKTMERIKKYR